MKREFSEIIAVFCVVLSLQTQSIASFVTAAAAPRGGAATRSRLTAGSSDSSGSSSSGSTATMATETTDTLPDIFHAGEMVVDDPAANRGPLKVLFLSSDTGGGHRASAESLAKQFQLHFPGSTYDLLDVWTQDGCLPYRTLVNSYKHLSAHPSQWRLLYHLSNTRPWEFLTDVHSQYTCERKIRRRMRSYNPDVVVSVHPAMNHVPMMATRKISAQQGRHIPFFTVVTDLGSGHCTWFHPTVDKLYLASDRLYRLAKRRGQTPDENIVMTGLPIRHDFAVQAAALGDRTTLAGQAYQTQIKELLSLNANQRMILVMGGGEGVGSLATIVEELYCKLTQTGVDATVCVVCGRNEKLQAQLTEKDWSQALREKQEGSDTKKLKKRGLVKRLLGRGDKGDTANDAVNTDGPQGKVSVVGLGFVTNMAEYMVAADVLVTKAGPGTIAEAAAVGLPVMLTSFLPGQEAGNVNFVVDKGFGEFHRDPVVIANHVAAWCQDPQKLMQMSHKARATGNPTAAAEIVLDIGSTTHTWKALNHAKTMVTKA